jgi:hypothetical protein
LELKLAIKIQPWLKITHAKNKTSMQQINQPWDKLEKLENSAIEQQRIQP